MSILVLCLAFSSLFDNFEYNPHNYNSQSRSAIDSMTLENYDHFLGKFEEKRQIFNNILGRTIGTEEKDWEVVEDSRFEQDVVELDIMIHKINKSLEKKNALEKEKLSDDELNALKDEKTDIEIKMPFARVRRIITLGSKAALALDIQLKEARLAAVNSEIETQDKLAESIDAIVDDLVSDFKIIIKKLDQFIEKSLTFNK